MDEEEERVFLTVFIALTFANRHTRQLNNKSRDIPQDLIIVSRPEGWHAPHRIKNANDPCGQPRPHCLLFSSITHAP